MKAPLLLLCLVAGLQWTAVSAQQNCDTLILYPQRELIAVIDSIADSNVYCTLCGVSPGQTQTIPLKMVAEIKWYGQGESTDSSQIVDVKALKEEAARKAATPEWTFTLKANEVVKKRLEKGIELKVKYEADGVVLVKKGELQTITPYYLVLENRSQALAIPKTSIQKIKLKRKARLLARVLGGATIVTAVLLFSGIGAAVALLLLGTGLLSFGQDANTRAFDEEINSGCGLALILLIVGVLVLLLSSINTSINDPFSDKWAVTTNQEAAGPAVEAEQQP